LEFLIIWEYNNANNNPMLTLFTKEITFMAARQSKYNIKLSLDDERDAHALDSPADMIHQKELDFIVQLLSDSLRKAQQYTHINRSDHSAICKSRPHDTIMINGERGSGKTTFVLSLLKFIQEGKLKQTGAVKPSFSAGYEILPILDPTLIEEKEHVFTNIISRIKDKVDIKAKSLNCFDGETNGLSQIHQQWQEAFRCLAEGLSAIKGIGDNPISNEAWFDSEFIMEQGIRRAHAANHLEENFHNYIYHSLKFLDKTAFLICFDDIDTNFAKGWPVLDVLHKYFTTPQLVTLLSGDMELYSILVRHKQLENFNNTSSENKNGNSEKTRPLEHEINDVVTRLESQYLLKLLRPERRIFLSNLYQKEESGWYNKIAVVWGKQHPLREECHRILSQLGIHNPAQVNLSFRFLTSLPIRSLKQILYAYATDQHEKYWAIADIFISELYEKGLDVVQLRNKPADIVINIIDYLLKNAILQDGYTLQTILTDNILNSAQFTLSAMFTTRAQNKPSLFFEYWIRIGITREISSLLRTKEGGNGFTLETFIDYCSINRGRLLRHTARMATAGIRATKVTPNTSWHATVPLSNINSPGGLETALCKKTLLQRIISRLPACSVTDLRGRSLPTYSFYNLLGIIGDTIDTVGKASTSQVFAEITHSLVKNAQLRSYPFPQAGALGGMDTEDDGSDSTELVSPDDDGQKLELFAKEIDNWHNLGVREQLTVSPALTGKIFTRFFYTMNSIDNNTKAKKWHLGEWMHRMVIAFLHAVVVEETLEQTGLAKTKIGLNNPITSDKLFIANLKKLPPPLKGQSLPFSRWLLSCPFWYPFLNPDTDLIDIMDEFTAGSSASWFKPAKCSVYNSLADVRVNNNSK
jgi:hypothetical protein